MLDLEVLPQAGAEVDGDADDVRRIVEVNPAVHRAATGSNIAASTARPWITAIAQPWEAATVRDKAVAGLALPRPIHPPTLILYPSARMLPRAYLLSWTICFSRPRFSK